MAELKDKVALVTGGGRGLGEAICQTLGESGVVVVVADLKKDLADCTAKEIQERGGRAEAVWMDVSNQDQVQEVLQHVVDEHGHLDFLINNAGTDVTVPVEELSVADWNRVIGVNLSGPFMTSRLAFPMMEKQGGGHIVNIVSTAAKRAWANCTAYHASKWGLLGLSYALHVEGRPKHIKVTALVAGGMRTPFLLDRFPDIDVNTLQDPKNVANTVRYVLTLPPETVIPEVMVLPMTETSWP